MTSHSTPSRSQRATAQTPAGRADAETARCHGRVGRGAKRGSVPALCVGAAVSAGAGRACVQGVRACVQVGGWGRRTTLADVRKHVAGRTTDVAATRARRRRTLAARAAAVAAPTPVCAATTDARPPTRRATDTKQHVHWEPPLVCSSRLRARKGQGHDVCSANGRRATVWRLRHAGCGARAAARWLRRAGCGTRGLRRTSRVSRSARHETVGRIA